MNKEFLEFWGKFLLDAAKGQKQLEEFSRWITGGFREFGDLTEQFKKVYGLDKLSEDDPEYPSLWEKSVKDFRETFKEYLELFNLVPREKYDELARQCEELKEKVRLQEEKIKQLERLLGERGIDYVNMAGEFQKLIEKQAKDFQKVLNSFANPFRETDSEKSGE